MGTTKEVRAAAAALGRVKTAKKAASSAENGKKGGRPYESLDSLFRALKNGKVELTDSLPTFGGAEPADLSGVWSWDETRTIEGSCAADLLLRARK